MITSKIKACCCVAALFLPSFSNAAIIDVLSSSLYSSDTVAMDAALGITGYEIESFDDTTLISGFSYSLLEPDIGPITELANVFAFEPRLGVYNSWDDEFILTSAKAGENSWNIPWAKGVKFMFDGGVNSLGLGLINFEIQGGKHTVLVNDTAVGTLESDSDFVSSVDRNGYLKVDAEAGEVINSVTILTENLDGMAFDRLAISRSSVSVPEPSSLFLFSSAMFLLLRRRYNI